MPEPPLTPTPPGNGTHTKAPRSPRPTPSGVVVRLDDGVIALDDVTGEPTWHYRREETALTAAYSTLDTERIALTFDKEQAEDHRTLDPRVEDLLVLDTATGEINAEQEIEEVGRRRRTVHGRDAPFCRSRGLSRPSAARRRSPR